MLLLVAKRMLRPANAAHHHHHHHHHHHLMPGCLPRRRCYSSASGAIESPAAKPPNFLTDHLITSWDFPTRKAAMISNRLSKPKATDNPDAVLRFLTRQGFAKSDIRSFTTFYPTLLPYSQGNTLDPNLRPLRDTGLSTSLLTQILLSTPATLHLRSAVPRIDLWSNFLGANNAPLLTAPCRTDPYIIGHVKRKVAFLESLSFSDNKIRRIAFTEPWFMTSDIGFIEKLLDRARELGSPTLSRRMFVAMLQVASQAREKLQEKKEFFECIGWSEDEFDSAVQKAPTMLEFCREDLRAKMDFLVGELGWNPSWVSSNPSFLTFSLEKRMRPRHRVLCVLESKGLFSGKRKEFTSAIYLPNIKFAEKYILPHMEEIPELQEAYLAACAS